MSLETLALIPARGGSKGIPFKNGRSFCGKPLVSWALDIGLATCTQTMLSTEDSTLACIGKIHGVDVIDRPRELATDEAPMLPVVKHALKAVLPWVPDVVVLLQPTQPLRTVRDVKVALQLLEDDHDGDVDSVVSVVPVPPHFAPDYVVRSVGRWIRQRSQRLTRRQDARTVLSRDGTVYCIRARTIRRGSLYGSHCIPLYVDPDQSVNIDDESDWKRAESLMRERFDEACMVTHG